MAHQRPNQRPRHIEQVNALVNGHNAGDVWLPRCSNLVERDALAQLRSLKGLAPLPICGTDILLPADAATAGLCEAWRRGDRVAGMALCDYLAERSIPRPAALVRLMECRPDPKADLYARIKTACECYSNRDWLASHFAGNEQPAETYLMQTYMPDLAAVVTFAEVVSLFREFDEATWKRHKYNIRRLQADSLASRRQASRAGRLERGTQPRRAAVREGESIPIDRIRVDGGTQQRVSIDDAKIEEYAEQLRDAELQERRPCPPVVVFQDEEGVYWLADGFYRREAHLRAGENTIRATVHRGDRRDAVLYSVGANASHGVPRSAEDKRQAVRTVLTDEEWSRWSNREIARRCEVSEFLVRTVRVELSAIQSQMDASAVDANPCASAHETQIDAPPTERLVHRGGTTYTMDTARIGETEEETEADAEEYRRLCEQRDAAKRETARLESEIQAQREQDRAEREQLEKEHRTLQAREAAASARLDALLAKAALLIPDLRTPPLDTSSAVPPTDAAFVRWSLDALKVAILALAEEDAAALVEWMSSRYPLFMGRPTE